MTANEDRRVSRPVNLAAFDATFWSGLALQALIFGTLLYVSVRVLETRVEDLPDIKVEIRQTGRDLSELRTQVAVLGRAGASAAESMTTLVDSLRRENNLRQLEVERRFAVVEAGITDIKQMKEQIGVIDQRSQRSYENINRLFDIARENQGRVRELMEAKTRKP